jgi:hypothetical protein
VFAETLPSKWSYCITIYINGGKQEEIDTIFIWDMIYPMAEKMI